MNHHKDTVLVISRLNYGENDRILTVLGQQFGKKRVLAKGVRKSTSKLAGNVELLSITNINIVQGKGRDLSILTGAKLVEYYPEIVKNSDSMMMVYEWLKLIDKLTLDDHGQDYFDLLRTSLNALNEQKISPKNVHIWLLIHIIDIGGYTLNFTNLAELTDGNLDFDFSSHQFVPSSVGGYDQAMVKLIKFYSEAQFPKEVVCAEPLQIASGKLLSEIIKRIV